MGFRPAAKVQPLGALYALLLTAFSAPAERLPIQRHGVSEGLAEETVTALLKDSRGYLWIGSLNGLSRYDGDRFRVYGLEDGLPKLRVFSLAESKDGAVWVATSGGIARLDPAESAARPVFQAVPVNRGAPRAAEIVFVDREGMVWAGSGGELFRFEKSDGSPNAEAAGLLAARPGGAVVRAIRESADGALWVGTSHGLFRRKAGALARVVPGGDAVEDVRGLFLDREGRVWVTTPKELVVFRPRDGNAASGSAAALAAAEPLVDPGGRVRLPGEGETRRLGPPPGAPGAVWQKPFQTKDGRYWVSTTAGLVVIDGEKFESFGRKNGLGDGILSDFVEDDEGNLWIGTQSTGLLRLSRNGFTSFTESDGLVDARIGTLFTDSERRLYASALGNATIYRLEGTAFHAVTLRLPTAPVSRWLRGGTVLLDREGEWWVATVSGLARYGRIPFGPGLSRAVPRVFYSEKELGGREVASLYEDRAGAIWIGMHDADPALIRLDRAGGSFRRFGAADGLPAGAPLNFAEDGAGNLWIAFGAGGLVRLRNGKFERVGPAEGAPEGFARDFLLDQTGRLWIANGPAGVLRVDAPAAERIVATSLATTAGPATGSVLGIAEDEKGFLWFGTTRGVDRLDPKTGRFRHFTTADGLANNLVTSIQRDAKGTLWFGTLEGISRLVPGSDASSPLPQAVITSFRVNGTPRPVPELGVRSLPGFVLEPGENRVRIDFDAPSFTPGERVRYQTRLEGVDAAWSTPTSDPIVRYVGLPAGAFRFSVRAAAYGDDAAGPPATLAFRIRPPFWRRWWFLLSAALVLVAVAFLIHRDSVNRAVAVERVRTRLATDLHDDVGSSLARISILSEVGRRHVEEGGEAARLLEEIGETSRAVIDALGDSIWSIDPRRDDLQSLGDRLHHFAADLLDGKGIAWKLVLPENAHGIELPAEPRRHLFLLLKEAVTNAALHSKASAVEIAFRVAGRMLEVEVTDDGRGLGDSRRAGGEGRGLSNMKTRAKALGALLVVDSEKGRGTRIRLTGLELPHAARVPA